MAGSTSQNAQSLAFFGTGASSSPSLSLAFPASVLQIDNQGAVPLYVRLGSTVGAATRDCYAIPSSGKLGPIDCFPLRDVQFFSTGGVAWQGLAIGW